jgi:hypothetical protein
MSPMLNAYNSLCDITRHAEEACEKLRRSKLEALAATSVMPNEEIDRIVNSSHVCYDLSVVDYARVKLAFILQREAWNEEGGIVARMYPLVYFPSGYDEEMDVMFWRNSRKEQPDVQ